MSTREHTNEYFNGRSFMVLCAVMLMAVTFVALVTGIQPPAPQGHGIFFTPPYRQWSTCCACW